MNFKGVLNPELYILDYHDEDTAYPLDGNRGDFVLSLLGSYGLLDKIRIGNPIIQGKDFIESDIKKVNPKLIISFGSKVISDYLNTNRKITEISGTIYDINIQGTSYKLLTMISPSYVLRRMEDSELSLKFSQDLYKAAQYLMGEYIDILKEKEILNAHSADEFIEICEDKFNNNSELAYDIETNARPPMMEGSRIIGFSLGNKATGVYVSLDSLDVHMSKEEEDKVWNYLINKIFAEKDKLIIHNTMYERPYTLHCKGYEIGFDKAHDTLVMARLLRSPKESAGLKYQAQKYLHYPDWETDLWTYITAVTNIINVIGLGPTKFKPLYNIIKNEYNIFKLGTHLNGLSDEDQLKISKYIGDFKSVLVDLYSPEEIYELGGLISYKIIEAVDAGGIQDSVIPYNWIPDRLLSKYGAVDALATYDLKDYFYKIMDEQSTDTIDLHKGYNNWLEHIYVTYIMERNGMYWDDKTAQEDKAKLTAQATEHLRSLLSSELMDPFIAELCEAKYKPIILSDYIPNIAQTAGFEVEYDHTTDKYILKENGKRVRKDRISEIPIPDYYSKHYLGLLQSFYETDINNKTTIDELKEIYNPGSVSSNDIPRQILITPDVQMGGRINDLNTLSESPSWNEDVIANLPILDQKFIKIAQLCCNQDELKKTYGDPWVQMQQQFYNGFVLLYKSSKDKVVTPEIKKILDNAMPVVIETFDDEGIIKIFDSMIVSGIDPDDESTWTPRFKWMIDFRLFKKMSKLVSTYLDGVCGTASVAVVDYDELHSGKHDVTRKRLYSEGIAKNNEDYLVMSKWAPNTAETGRWRSSWHTLPWNSPIKRYYGSRFKGGTTICPDYSQMEVRTLAAVSHDENMLELFSSGKDFHTETAKKIYRKDEVTPAERRFSKTATFSLNYGSSVESFARKYCQGDIEYAKMIYQGFFNAYPNVEKWIEEKHAEAKREHRVSLGLSNRFIPINPESNDPGAIGHMLRKAQNYPIQGISSDIVGCVVYDIQKYIEENNLKSMLFMAVHDSIEIDVYPYEMLQFIGAVQFILNDSPKRRMGLPSAADVALGKSLGHEIEMTNLEVNEDFTEGTISLKGYKDEIDETVNNWRDAYALVEVSDEEFEDVYISMKELFILRKAYTPTIRTTRQKGKCKVHIRYY